jgi:hypothetical protein
MQAKQVGEESEAGAALAACRRGFGRVFALEETRNAVLEHLSLEALARCRGVGPEMRRWVQAHLVLMPCPLIAVRARPAEPPALLNRPPCPPPSLLPSFLTAPSR